MLGARNLRRLCVTSDTSTSLLMFFSLRHCVGHGEVRVYRGTGVSRGVRPTTWERSLKNWELQISCFEEFWGGENVLGLVPASLPHTLGYACTFYDPTSPPPTVAFVFFFFVPPVCLAKRCLCDSRGFYT